MVFYGNNLPLGLVLSFDICFRRFAYCLGVYFVLSLSYHVLVCLAAFLFWLFDFSVLMEFPRGDFFALNFVLPCQGLVLNVHPNFMQHRLNVFSRMVVAVVIDQRNMRIHKLQHIINANWLLMGNVTVRYKYINFFILEFSETSDMFFMLSNGPWVVQNCLLIMERWNPNMSINNLRVTRLTYGLDLRVFQLIWFA